MSSWDEAEGLYGLSARVERGEERCAALRETRLAVVAAAAAGQIGVHEVAAVAAGRAVVVAREDVGPRGRAGVIAVMVVPVPARAPVTVAVVPTVAVRVRMRAGARKRHAGRRAE